MENRVETWFSFVFRATQLKTNGGGRRFNPPLSYYNVFFFFRKRARRRLLLFLESAQGEAKAIRTVNGIKSTKTIGKFG